MAALPALFEGFRRLRYSKNGLETRVLGLIEEEKVRTASTEIKALDPKARRQEVWSVLKRELGTYPATYLVDTDLRTPFTALLAQYGETLDPEGTAGS